jgi:hypothetical protein
MSTEMALTGASAGFMVKYYSSTLFYESALASKLISFHYFHRTLEVSQIYAYWCFRFQFLWLSKKNMVRNFDEIRRKVN